MFVCVCADEVVPMTKAGHHVPCIKVGVVFLAEPVVSALSGLGQEALVIGSRYEGNRKLQVGRVIDVGRRNRSTVSPPVFLRTVVEHRSNSAPVNYLLEVGKRL